MRHRAVLLLALLALVSVRVAGADIGTPTKICEGIVTSGSAGTFSCPLDVAVSAGDGIVCAFVTTNCTDSPAASDDGGGSPANAWTCHLQGDSEDNGLNGAHIAVCSTYVREALLDSDTISATSSCNAAVRAIACVSISGLDTDGSGNLVVDKYITDSTSSGNNISASPTAERTNAVTIGIGIGGWSGARTYTHDEDPAWSDVTGIADLTATGAVTRELRVTYRQFTAVGTAGMDGDLASSTASQAATLVLKGVPPPTPTPTITPTFTPTSTPTPLPKGNQMVL